MRAHLLVRIYLERGNVKINDVRLVSEAVITKPGPYPLKKSATESSCPRKEVGYSRSPSKYLSRRSRQQQPESQRRGRSKSVGHEDLNEDSKSRRLFPKWSRVKEAFGWESERKNSIKAKSESGSNLTTRRRSDESSRQTYRHPGSPIWYQNYPSIHSSVEDIHEEFEGRWKKMSVVSEKYSDHLDIPHEALRRQKSTPSPGSEKIPSCRDADLKPKSFTIERDSYRSQDFSKFEKEDAKRGKSPWGRVKTIIERHRDSIKRRSLRQEPSATDLASTFSKITEDSLDFKDDPDDLESTSKPSGVARPSRRKANKPGFIVLEPEKDPQTTLTFLQHKLPIVTNMESRFPAMRVLWLGREFYRDKYGMTSSSHVWFPDLGDHLGDFATNLATKYGISKVLESSRYFH
ncbi:hypothetical protein AVEN_37380-1 [Araneus ventricosus]|uniref:Uncharacterized protein n=1 Tax=Araneus ventricosus TaxID=182803 RepID=A0A4Y2LG79_ARAVE|nr:hypothetical protein AVEN_37380-1 [Araneus ventricosus]